MDFHDLKKKNHDFTFTFFDIVSIQFQCLYNFLYLQIIFTSICDISIFLENESYVKWVV